MFDASVPGLALVLVWCMPTVYRFGPSAVVAVERGYSFSALLVAALLEAAVL